MSGNAMIRIRRGSEAELSDVILEVGELGFTTDTHKLFIGSDIGNIFLTKGSAVKSISKSDFSFEAHSGTTNIGIQVVIQQE